jgi:transposase
MKPRKFVRPLTDEERQKLLNTLSNEGLFYPSIYRKVKAVLLSEQGKTVQEIAEELGVTEPAVTYILRNFEREGIDEFLSKKGGRKERITNEQKETILRLVQEFTPQEFGLKKKYWTYDGVARVMKKVYNVKMSYNTVRKILLDRDIDLKMLRYKGEDETSKLIESVLKRLYGDLK